MPHDSDSIPLPAPLLDALHQEIEPDERSRFVADAVAAALLHRRLAERGEDPGLEPWWPLDRAEFMILSSGEYRLQRREEGEE
jgi:hypothetical protein